MAQKPCPRCGSDDIEHVPSPCLCSDRHTNPCWSYPECNRCGYSNYSSGANSEGTYWGSFTGEPRSTEVTSEVQIQIDAYDLENNSNQG